MPEMSLTPKWGRFSTVVVFERGRKNRAGFLVGFKKSRFKNCLELQTQTKM